MKKKPKSKQKASLKPRRKDQLAEQYRWMARANEVANAPLSEGGSTHPTIKVGAVLVDKKGREIASGSNRFARGIDRRRRERYRDGNKSLWNNCAEQIAFAGALRKGKKTKGADLYSTLDLCASCAGIAVEAEIRRVIIPVGARHNYAGLKPKWRESIDVGTTKLAEAGIEVIYVDSDVAAVHKPTRTAQPQAVKNVVKLKY